MGRDRRWASACDSRFLAVLGRVAARCWVLPGDKLFHQRMQSFSFLRDVLVGGELVWMRRRVVNQLCKWDSAGGGKRPPGPPQNAEWRVAVADGFLPCGFLVDRLERDADFNQLAFRGVCHRWCPLVGRSVPTAGSAWWCSSPQVLAQLSPHVGGGKVAEVDASEVLGDVAELVVFRSVWADFDHHKAMRRGGRSCREDFVEGDGEVLPLRRAALTSIKTESPSGS